MQKKEIKGVNTPKTERQNAYTESNLNVGIPQQQTLENKNDLHNVIHWVIIVNQCFHQVKTDYFL